MTPRLNALSVHLLTATGAVLSMLAMLAAVDGEWSLMFLWLVVALEATEPRPRTASAREDSSNEATKTR